MLYKDDSGTVTMSQDISVGLMATAFNISRADRSISLKFDGAYFLDGNVEIDASGEKLYRSRLISVSPNWDKVLNDSGLAKTLNLVLKAEVFVDLKTVVNAAVKGTAAYQAPGDFAIGIDARYDSKTGKWAQQAHTLASGKNLEINSAFTDAGFALKKFSGRFSSGIEVGYTVQTQASSPYFESNSESAIAKALNAAKSGLSGEMSLYSASRIGAGVTLDLNVGSSVAVDKCRVNVSGEMGYAFIHFLQFRAGTVLDSFSVYDTKNTLFSNAANVIYTWDMFSRQPEVFVKSKWCGSSSALVGITNNSKSSRIFVTDQATGDVVGDSGYVLTSLLKKPAMVSVKVPLAVTATIDPVEKIKLRVRTDATDQARYVINADVSGMGFGSAATGWVYEWRSVNDDVTLDESNAAVTTFKVTCKGGCNSRLPIRLNLTTPDGDHFTMPFFLDYDSVPKAAGKAEFTADGLLLDASAATDAEGALQQYLWKSSSGLTRSSAKPVLIVLRDEDFYQDVIRGAAVSLSVKDSAGQYASLSLRPQAVMTLLSPQQLVANQFSIDAVTAGKFTLGEKTLVTIDGKELTPGLGLTASFGVCTVQYRSTFSTSFSCASQVKGAGVLSVTRDDGVVLMSKTVTVTTTSLGAVAVTQASASAVDQGTAYVLVLNTDKPVEKLMLDWGGTQVTAMTPVSAGQTMPNGNTGWTSFSYAMPAAANMVARTINYQATATELGQAVGTLSGTITVRAVQIGVTLDATPLSLAQYENVVLVVRTTALVSRVETVVDGATTYAFPQTNATTFSMTIPMLTAGTFSLVTKVYAASNELIYTATRSVTVLAPAGVAISNLTAMSLAQGETLLLSVNTSSAAANVVMKFGPAGVGYGWVTLPATNAARTTWALSKVMSLSGIYFYSIEARNSQGDLLGLQSGVVDVRAVGSIMPAVLSLKGAQNPATLAVAVNETFRAVYDCACGAATVRFRAGAPYNSVLDMPSSFTTLNRWERDFQFTVSGTVAMEFWALNSSGSEIDNSRRSVLVVIQ